MTLPDISDRTKKAAKAVGSLIALAYFFYSVPLAESLRQITTLSAVGLFVLFVISCLTIVTSTFAIHALLRQYADPAFTDTLSLYLANLFINSFIPSRAGSLVSMPLLLKRQFDLPPRDGAVVQGTNLAIVAFLIGATGIFALVEYVNALPTNVLLLVGSGITVYLGFAGVVGVGHTSLVDRLPDRLPDVDVQFTRETGVAAMALFVSTLVFVGLRFAVITTQFGVAFTPLEYVLIPTLAYTVNVLPISLSGIGVAEATATTVLVSLGVPPSLAATIVLTDRIVSAYFPVVLSGLATSLSPIASIEGVS